MATHRMGKLQFFSNHAGLAEPMAFQPWMAPLLQCEWGGYAQAPKSPFETTDAQWSLFVFAVVQATNYK